MKAMLPPRNVLITGASSGIGAALAHTYAGGGMTLALSGRDEARLEATARDCRNRGAHVITAVIDVTEQQHLFQWVREIDRLHPLDLIIANAGIASTLADKNDEEHWDTIRQVFDVNLHGTLATIHPAIEAMRKRRRGQIALMSSLSGYCGMPISPAYSASKAAVKVYGEALRGWLAPQGVGVTVICPGFVKSPMSDRYPRPTPFRLSAEEAAARIKKGLSANRARIAFPFPLTLGTWFLALLPPSMSLYLQRVLRVS